MIPRILVPILITGVTVFSAAARAQEVPDTFRLRAISVTATRLPLPRTAAPAAVTILYGDDLRARGVRFLADALREVPGATVAQTGSRGGITGLFLRGGESDYVQVLVDGVAMNDPGGAFDIGQLTTDNIERIEIVRGPVSVLYGSDAVAGVVHIFTRQGVGPARITASAGLGRAPRRNGEAAICPGYPGVDCPDNADLGSYSTRNYDLSFAGGSRSIQYSFSAARFDTDGAYAFNNDYENLTLSGRLRMAQNDRSELIVSSRWTDGLFHYPTDGAGRLADRNVFRSSESLAAGFEAGHFFTPRLEARLALSTHNGEYITDDQKDGAADTLGSYASLSLSDITRRKADLRANVHVHSNTILTLGIETERQDGTSQFSSQSSFGPFESASENDRSNRAAYTQIVSRALEPLTITAGGRAEDNDRFGTFLTWRVGANLRAGAGMTLRAAAGTAFKEPTFFENYAEGFVTGNTNLQPEQSRNWEVGAEKEFLDGKASFGLTWFDQRFTNLIQFNGNPAPGQPNYINIGEAKAAGLDVEARYGALTGPALSGNYTFLDTEVLDAGTGSDPLFQSGQQLIRRPKHKLSVVGSAPLGARAHASATVLHVGQRDDLDYFVAASGRRTVLPSYTTVAVTAQLQPFRAHDIRISGRVENLLGEKYREIPNFPSQGRSLFVGVTAGLGF